MQTPFIPSIRFIYFDFDNVLAVRAENRSELVARMLNLPNSTSLREFYFVSFHDDSQLESRYLHLQTVDEEIAFYHDIFGIFARREGVENTDAQLWAAAKAFVRVPVVAGSEVRACLEQLQRNYALGILSNGLPSRRQEVMTSGLGDYFKQAVISCDYGVEKPARAIYEIAIKAAGLPAANIALVDDEASNIRGAEDAGFGQAILFTPAFWLQVQPKAK